MANPPNLHDVLTVTREFLEKLEIGRGLFHPLSAEGQIKALTLLALFRDLCTELEKEVMHDSVRDAVVCVFGEGLCPYCENEVEDPDSKGHEDDCIVPVLIVAYEMFRKRKKS